MKNKKTKILSVIFIGFFFMLIGSPFINGETQTKILNPNQYWALGTTLQTGDTLNFRIDSDPMIVNVYIMNQEQLNTYLNDSQDEAKFFIKSYDRYTPIISSFIASYDQQYYILMINPSDHTDTYVVIDASVDEYIPKTITITSPIGMDTFDVGNVHITWTSTGDFDYVKIDLYENGAFLKTISSATSNDGSYDWYIYVYDDYIDGSNYQIKITDYDDDSICDYSDYFSIEIEPYDTYSPYEQSQLFLIILFWIISILMGIGIVVAVILVKKNKKKSQKEPIIVQEKEIPKVIYCSECGSEVDKEKIYCSNCGSKVKK